MQDHILLGRGETTSTVSSDIWRQQLAGAPELGEARLSFMTPAHHLVRNTVVCTLPRNHGMPLTPAAIARLTHLPRPRVDDILDDLERHLFFLVRNPAGEVGWAFPVTVEPTPHRLRFSSGEQLFAA